MKYVRLWGPLWTHSAFGFESFNGHLQYLCYSKTNIIDQLVFNVDIQQTLQLLLPSLAKHESSDILQPLSIKRKPVNRAKMQKINDFTYVVGKTVQHNNSAEDSSSLGILAGNVTIFMRLFYQGIVYHSLFYRNEGCKRNDRVCHFKHDNYKFGVIKYFILSPQPVAVIKAFKPSQRTYLERASHPCRAVLEQYKEINLMSLFIYEIHPTDRGPIIVIPITEIIGKRVHLELKNKHFDYVLSMPNKFEHLKSE